MKGKNEIVAIAIMLVVCLLFAACAQKAETKLTDKATDPALVSTTAAETTTAASDAETSTDGKSTDTAEPKADDAVEVTQNTGADKVSISENEALKALQNFYGSLYTVERDGTSQYTVKDNNGKEYAKVTVDLKTGYATETVTGTGEVNKVNLLV